MVAKKTAAVPKTVVQSPPSDPEDISAPTIVIPEIAFAPDIKGVWRVDGTLLINSKPKKIAKTKTKISKTKTYMLMMGDSFSIIPLTTHTQLL